jgi:hypothetical protein
VSSEIGWSASPAATFAALYSHRTRLAATVFCAADRVLKIIEPICSNKTKMADCTDFALAPQTMVK